MTKHHKLISKSAHPLKNIIPANIRPSGMTRLAKVNWTILLWAIGVPLPLVGIIALMRGCS